MSLIKVLLMGSYGLLMESLITRFSKEGCELFVITGSKVRERKKHSQIIEEYNFEYDNENVQNILESTKADIAIFTGAFDSKFQWKKQSESIDYIGGLYNILISASRTGIRRFIYVSTTDVYDNILEDVIDEDSPTNSSDLMTFTIKSGEDIALSYDNKNGMQVAVLRCSEIYGFHNDYYNQQGFSTKLYMELSQMKEPAIDFQKKHNFIHISDVTDVICRTAFKKQISYQIYNICTEKRFTEAQVLDYITEITGVSSDVIYRGDSLLSQAEYSSKRAVSDLGFSIMNSGEEEYKLYLDQLSNYRMSLMSKQKRGFFFRKMRNSLQSIFEWLFPYIETLIVFAIVQIIVSFTSSSEYVSAIDFYLLYVVLIAIIYGKGQTIISLLLCLVGKIFITDSVVTPGSIVVDYNTYLWMLQLLIVGMSIGYIRDRYRQSIEDKKEENCYLDAELAEIKQINSSNLRIKKIYESRLINYNDSFAKIYTIVSRLDDLEPDKVVFAAVDVVSDILESSDVVIYNVERKSHYARLAASSAQSTHTGIKSTTLESFGEVYEEIFKHKVYVNRSMDSNKPSMAGGIFSKDTLKAIVLVWSLPFENTTLHNVNMFSVVLKLITIAMQRSQLHVEESRLSRFVEDTSILTAKSFDKIVNIQKQGSSTKHTNYYLLEIIRNGLTNKQLNDKITQILRSHDYLGMGQEDRLYLLLTNTNEHEAEFVIKRLAKINIDVRKEVIVPDGD